MARLAHQMAMQSTFVTADVIEANDFQSLSQRYAVQAVPKTIVNDQVEIVGALRETQFVEQVWRAVPDAAAPEQ